MESVDNTLAFELEKAWKSYEYIYSVVYNMIEELGWTIHEGHVRIKIDQLRSDESEQASAHTIKEKIKTIERSEKTMAEIRDNMAWAAGEAGHLKEVGKSPYTLLFWYAKTETLMEYLWLARDRGVAAIASLETRVLEMKSEEVPCSSIMEKRGRWTRVDMSARQR